LSSWIVCRLPQVMTGRREEPALRTIGALGFLTRRDQFLAGEPALRGIANGGSDEQLAADAERSEADACRELAAIGAQGEQIGNAGTHLPTVRVAHETGRVPDMIRAQPLGDQQVERFADQGFRCVAEQLPDGLVRKADPIGVVDDDQRIGGKLQQVLGDFAQLVHGFKYAWLATAGRRT